MILKFMRTVVQFSSCIVIGLLLPCITARVLGEEATDPVRVRNITQLLVHNEELNGLYSLPNIVRVIKSRRLRWAGQVARTGEGRGVYRVLVGKPEGKRPLGRPRRRWEDDVRMDLQEVECGREDWIGLAQDRDRCRALVSEVRKLRVP
jgi:hypothetical protein